MTTDAGQRTYFERLHERLRQRYGSRSLYDALGVEPKANEAEIRSRFRQKALKYHPDRNKSLDAEKRFIDANDIYEILSDSAKRESYDSFLSITSGKAQAGTANAAGSSAPHQRQTRTTPPWWQYGTTAQRPRSPSASPADLEARVADFVSDRKTLNEAIRGLNFADYATLIELITESQDKRSKEQSQEYRKKLDDLEARFDSDIGNLLRNLGIRE